MNYQFTPQLQTLVNAVNWRIASTTSNTKACDAIIQLQKSLEVNAIELLKLAKFHGVVAWLKPYNDCISIGSDELSKEISRHYKIDFFNCQMQLKNAEHLSRLFTENQIDHLVFKGPSTLKKFYKGFVDIRPSDDLDVLVSPKDTHRAAVLLGEGKYRARQGVDANKVSRFVVNNSDWYRWRDIGFINASLHNHKLDLHWYVADRFTLPSNTNYLLANSSSFELFDQEIPCLEFSFFFIYTCVHGGSDYFFRLRYLVDVYTAMQQPEFNLSDIKAMAEDYGVAKKVTDAIELALLLFNESRAGQFNDNELPNDFIRYAIKAYAEQTLSRAHPNKALWTKSDKRKHLFSQIKNRSTRSYFLAPLVARLKYTVEMVEALPCPQNSGLKEYPCALLRRVLS